MSSSESEISETGETGVERSDRGAGDGAAAAARGVGLGVLSDAMLPSPPESKSSPDRSSPESSSSSSSNSSSSYSSLSPKTSLLGDGDSCGAASVMVTVGVVGVVGVGEASAPSIEASATAAAAFSSSVGGNLCAAPKTNVVCPPHAVTCACSLGSSHATAEGLNSFSPLSPCPRRPFRATPKVTRRPSASATAEWPPPRLACVTCRPENHGMGVKDHSSSSSSSESPSCPSPLPPHTHTSVFVHSRL
mmetsp:Transcript_31746/g.83157  ORF Transcript_31746/g.83157 Transcript_31746/m.83157 type:complete len:248 (+) Transcript_31746:1086-1829(+)